LPSDNWAILTVIVLMNTQFVGAFASKAIMRAAGTIAGGFVGVWLVGDYASTPAIFLPVFFLVMTFAGYKFGQLGARQVPYAYFLLGLTTLTIATDGVSDPGQAWQIGVARTEEILVGIICSLLVTSLLWPRYAREEFLEAGRDALKTVSQLVSIRARAYLGSPNAPIETEKLHHTFGQRLSALRNLRQAGARESTFFSARLSHYNAFLVALSDLFHAGLDLGRHRGEACFLNHVRHETEALLAAIREEFDILAGPRSPGEPLRPGRINEAFATFEQKVHEIREQGVSSAAPLEMAIAFAGSFAALRSLRDGLNNIRGAMGGLPRLGQPPQEPQAHGDFLPTIDWLWLKIGIKGGLAAVISIVFLKWIHPPGSANIPIWAWLLIVQGRSFLRLGSTGDLRAFQTALRGSVILAACAVLLLLTTPFLADYAMMNLTLFLILFAVGFLTARIPGIDFWTEFAALTISAFVALNPQQPVAAQTIIDTFIGIMFGLWIATVVGRVLWPLLPQKALRDNLLALFTHPKALFSGDPHQEQIQAQMATLPVEALQAVHQIRMAGCSKAEKARLTTLVHALQMLIVRITQLVSHRSILPEIAEPVLQLQFERLEVEFKQMLDAFAGCFRQGDCRRQFPTTRGALAGMDDAVQKARESGMFAGKTTEMALRMLNLVDHYHATAAALDECGRLLRNLQIERYWGDYGL
jgi:Fusaric acid resistance protein family